MANEGLVKTYIASGAIAKHRIVVHGSGDAVVTLASSSTGLLIGVSDSLGAAANGDPVDIIRSGIANVEYGSTVTRGQKLTSDSTGRAVSGSLDAGVNAQIIGIAEVSGVVGDIGKVFISPGTIQG